MNKAKLIFIWSGSISCFLVGVFFVFLLYAAAAQKEWVNSYVLLGVDLYENAVVIIFVCYGLLITFGWVAVYAGRRLPCSECGEPILVKDMFGFRGMACKAVRRVIQGRQICSNCLKEST
jgi:hypothetical protein